VQVRLRELSNGFCWLCFSDALVFLSERGVGESVTMAGAET
jgi:hypothetical protein